MGGHIEKAFIDALLLANRNLATFTIEAATKVAVDAYGYDIYSSCISIQACRHIGVGFLLFIRLHRFAKTSICR